MRRVLVNAGVLFVGLGLLGCSGGDGDAPPGSPTAMPSETATPAIFLTPAAPLNCPLTDPFVCKLALDLQAALETKDIAAIAQLLLATRRPCSEISWQSGDDVGCTSASDTSDPVVSWFSYGSDCCVAHPLLFAGRLAEFLDVSPGGWRAAGIVENEPFWPSRYAILMSAGDPTSAPVVEFGLSEEQSGKIAGAIWAPAGPPQIHPDATLRLWP